jgi:hypothetical protein
MEKTEARISRATVPLSDVAELETKSHEAVSRGFSTPALALFYSNRRSISTLDHMISKKFGMSRSSINPGAGADAVFNQYCFCSFMASQFSAYKSSSKCLVTDQVIVRELHGNGRIPVVI